MQYEFVEIGISKLTAIENTMKVKFWTNESFYEESSSLCRLKEEQCKVIQQDISIALTDEIFPFNQVIHALRKIFQIQKTAKMRIE